MVPLDGYSFNAAITRIAVNTSIINSYALIVNILHFVRSRDSQGTDSGDGFRRPGFLHQLVNNNSNIFLINSKQRTDPVQIHIT